MVKNFYIFFRDFKNSPKKRMARIEQALRESKEGHTRSKSQSRLRDTVSTGSSDRS